MIPCRWGWYVISKALSCSLTPSLTEPNRDGWRWIRTLHLCSVNDVDCCVLLSDDWLVDWFDEDCRCFVMMDIRQLDDIFDAIFNAINVKTRFLAHLRNRDRIMMLSTRYLNSITSLYKNEPSFEWIEQMGAPHLVRVRNDLPAKSRPRTTWSINVNNLRVFSRAFLSTSLVRAGGFRGFFLSTLILLVRDQTSRTTCKPREKYPRTTSLC